MSMRRTIAGVALAAAVSLGGGLSVTSYAGPVHRSVMVDCEDMDVQPCITFDDSHWRRVDSYAPYTSHAVRPCRAHRNYPCVATRRGRTFNYYWRGRF